MSSNSMSGWFVYSASHKAKIKVIAGLHAYLEPLRKNLLQSSFRSLAEFGYFWL